MIIINFKAYKEALDWRARKLSKKCQKIADRKDKRIISVPQTQDIRLCKGETFAQHLDGVEPGSHTGRDLPEGLKRAGASGTLLNHSENRISKEEIMKGIERCRDLGLETVVCAQNPDECEDLSELKPDFIAFEPTELIGGDTSVSSARPELIEDAVDRSKVDVLTGAGIKDRQDVKKSIDLGCKGVLVASGVVKSDNPEEKLKELCEGL